MFRSKRLVHVFKANHHDDRRRRRRTEVRFAPRLLNLEDRMLLSSRSSLVRAADLSAAVSLGDPSPTLIHASGMPSDLTFSQISTNGFGDWQNSYSWSMEWFKGKIYVGTNRYSPLQAIVAAFPFVGDLEDFHPPPGDDGAAEIWSYTPENNTWERVFKSPTDIPNPDKPGTFLARDNAFRCMAVLTEADGTEALYAGGVVYNATARPRILRSTDGVTWTPIPMDPGTFLGDLPVDNYRAMTAYHGRLYVTAGSILGEGILLEAANPAGGNNNFRQVSPPGMIAFEIQTFNDHLYVGTADIFAGYGLFRTDAIPTSNPYYDFTSVVTDGAFGRDILISRPSSVISMAVYNGGLYVGSAADIIRVETNDTWQLIVGDPRLTPQGFRFPLSGMPNGFGNPFINHIWRMEAHEGRLYVGTWDLSTFLRPIPFIGPLAVREAGTDFWESEDGVHFSSITRDGFGDPFNHGIRSLVSTPVGLFLGTVNPWEGTQVWLGRPSVSNSAASFSTTGTPAAIGNSDGRVGAGLTREVTISRARPRTLFNRLIRSFVRSFARTRPVPVPTITRAELAGYARPLTRVLESVNRTLGTAIPRTVLRTVSNRLTRYFLAFSVSARSNTALDVPHTGRIRQSRSGA